MAIAAHAPRFVRRREVEQVGMVAAAMLALQLGGYFFLVTEGGHTKNWSDAAIWLAIAAVATGVGVGLVRWGMGSHGALRPALIVSFAVTIASALVFWTLAPMPVAAATAVLGAEAARRAPGSARFGRVAQALGSAMVVGLTLMMVVYIALNYSPSLP